MCSGEINHHERLNICRYIQLWLHAFSVYFLHKFSSKLNFAQFSGICLLVFLSSKFVTVLGEAKDTCTQMQRITVLYCTVNYCTSNTSSELGILEDCEGNWHGFLLGH